jgi:pimeloyl-ACP methyl ester carboxylesterase
VALPTTTSAVTVSIDGRSFPARLVQPTGSNPGAYPVVAFGHGFAQTASRYASTLAALAARGYVVIAPDSQTWLLPNHGRFADDLERSLRWARGTQPNAHPTLDAVAGHSMGGGAALLAADRHPEIDAVMTLAAAETIPSATTASAGVTVPGLYVVGSRDTIVRPATTRAMYDRKPAPARFVTITGGYHCGFNDSTSFFGLGCDSGSITRSTQLAVTRELLGDWLDSTLRGQVVVATGAGITTESK